MDAQQKRYLLNRIDEVAKGHTDKIREEWRTVRYHKPGPAIEKLEAQVRKLNAEIEKLHGEQEVKFNARTEAVAQEAMRTKDSIFLGNDKDALSVLNKFAAKKF